MRKEETTPASGCGTQILLVPPADLKRSGSTDQVLHALQKRLAIHAVPKWKEAMARALLILLPGAI